MAENEGATLSTHMDFWPGMATIRYRRLLFAMALAAGLALVSPVTAEQPVDFGRDIRPILSNKCFACHGPDDAKRKAALRLDRKVGIYSETTSGVIPVVPGDPEASELIRRIESTDPAEHMPPPDAGKQLLDDER